MSDPAASVKGLLADIDRVAAAFDASRVRSERRLREAGRELEAVREAEQGARTRAERAEQATAILREEREVIRSALRDVAGDPASGSETREVRS